jgi:hypothetical protein
MWLRLISRVVASHALQLVLLQQAASLTPPAAFQAAGGLVSIAG